MTSMISRRRLARAIDIINDAADKLYGDEWWPGRASAWIDDGEWLENWFDTVTKRTSITVAHDVLDAFNEYAAAKFRSNVAWILDHAPPRKRDQAWRTIERINRAYERHEKERQHHA